MASSSNKKTQKMNETNETQETKEKQKKNDKKKKEREMFEEVKKLLFFTAMRHQQNNYELLSDWNEYDSQNPHTLKNFIGMALYGPPEAEQNEFLESIEDTTFKYKSAHKMKKINQIYKKIVEHGTQNAKDKKILCSLMYNVVIHDKLVKAVIDKIQNEENFNGDCLMEYVQLVPFFKVLKNIVEKKKDKNIKKGEKKAEEKMEVDKEKEEEKMDVDKEKEEEKMDVDKEKEEGKIEQDIEHEDKSEEQLKTVKIELYYIDDDARVYKSWSDYLTKNVLPPCVMVLPFGGEYQGEQELQWSEEKSYVWVETHKSPACSNKYLGVLDTTATVLGFGCLGVALLNPVSASVAIGSAIGMGITSVWTIGRSSHELVDRSKHDQSINVTNKEGFACWLGIASSALAVASTGGSVLLSRAVKNGTSVKKVAEVAHDIVQFSTLGTTVVGAGFSVYNIVDTYKETKTVSKQEVINLAATLLLLGNSVINLKLSKTIIESQQTSIIKDYEASLRSNRHRKEFQKMIRNTKSIVSDPTKVNEHVIRGINKIQNQNEFFSTILKNRKSFAAEGVKPAFVEGKITVDGKTLMNPIDFVKGLTKAQNSMNPITVKPTIAPSTSAVTIPNESAFDNALANFIRLYGRQLVTIASLKIREFLYVLTDINRFDSSDVIFSKLLVIALKIAKTIIQDEYPATNLFVRVVEFLWNFIKTTIREALSELCVEVGFTRKIAMKVVLILYESVEKKLDEWVFSFKKYLQIKVKEVEDKVKNSARILLSNGTSS